MTALHQALPTLAGRDAIGRHTLRLRTLLRRAGFESEIFAGDSHEDVQGEARRAEELSELPEGSWVLYHFSVGSDMVDLLRSDRLKVGLDYHNITEAHFFQRWEPAAASVMRQGREQLAAMAPCTRFALADSSFNRDELIALGFAHTAVVPILIDFTDYDGVAEPTLLERRRRHRQAGGADWLFVGRLAPNKCQHDIIAAFAAYRALYDPRARLTLIGGQSSGRYFRALLSLAAELGVESAVTLTDVVDHDALLACYATSDVFVVLSEHEGFNVPVVEAMHFGLPIVALAAGAVPETVGSGGILLEDKDPVLVAAAVDRVLQDRSLRDELKTAAAGRVAHFSLGRTGSLMLDSLTALMRESE